MRDDEAAYRVDDFLTPQCDTWPVADPAIVQAMLGELASPAFAGGYVVQMPSGKRIDPAEVWMPDVGGWVRADGSLLMLDRARGYFRLEPDDAAEVRRILEASTHDRTGGVQ